MGAPPGRGYQAEKTVTVKGGIVLALSGKPAMGSISRSGVHEMAKKPDRQVTTLPRH